MPQYVPVIPTTVERLTLDLFIADVRYYEDLLPKFAATGLLQIDAGPD